MSESRFPPGEGLRVLSREEALQVKGGNGWLQLLLKFTSYGVTYFFKMGVREGRRMRDLI